MKHRVFPRFAALGLCLLLVLSLFGGVTVSADEEIWTVDPTGWINWGHVNYQTVTTGGKTYVLNWGVRGELCRFRSEYALNFYPTASDGFDWCYDLIDAYAGGTSQDDAVNSPLYAQLHSFLAGKQTHVTDYAETRQLYRYTDCMVSDSSYISSFYSGIKLNGAWDSGATWNREHTWPKSKASGSQNGDIMMLRPTSVKENSTRGNTAYGESAGFYHPNREAGTTGFDLRGDCARICLYCYVRWSENAGNMWGAAGVVESLDVLLDWMEQDPVDTWEMGRNDAVESITGVRNCFVDYPELAWALFGREVPESYPTPFKEDHNNFVSAPAYLLARSSDEDRGTVTVKGWAVDCKPESGYYASGYDLWTVDGQESLGEGPWPCFRWENGRLLYFPATEADYLVEIHFTPAGEEDPCPTGHAWNEGELVAPPTAGEDGAILYTCTRCGKTWSKALPAGATFWVCFDLNGYGYNGPEPQEVAPGETAADPGFTDHTDGMIFDGWYTEPECLHPYDFSAPVVDDLTLYASYVRGHVIHFEPNGALEGGMEDVYVKHGEAFELPECGFLYAGKAFADWAISGISGEFDPGYPIAVFQDLTVTAAWKTAYISFYANGGSGYMSSVNCPIGGLYTLPTCTFSPPVGKHFAGWDLGQPGEVVVIYGDQVLSALWDENVYAVHFEANGGSGSMSDLVLPYGSRLVLPDCGFSPPEGQTLCKWSIPDAAEPWEYFYVGQETVVKSDLTVYAQWTPTDTETCTVTFESNGGSGSMASLHVEKGCSFTLPYCSFSPPDGRLFRYWMDEASSYSPGTVVSIDSDMTFSAFWRQATYYTVSFDVQGHGATPDSQRILHGEKAIRPPDPVEEGWTFIDWYRNTNFVYFFNFSEAIRNNCTAYAYWKQTVYSLHLETDGNGTAELSAEEATMDTEITVTATPDEGYVVDKIICTPAGGETVDITETGSFTMPAANVAVAVSFKPIETISYPITLEVVGSGWAGLSEEEAEPWQRITVQTAAYGDAALLRVLLITEDGTERDITERMGFNMPEGPATVRVEFEQLPGFIWLFVGDGGTASCSAEAAFPGEEITVNAVPDPGYRLKSITVTADYETFEDVTRTGKFTMPDSDVWVDVVFEELPPVPVYAVTLTVGEGGTARVFPEPAEAGEEITVTAEPADTYRLKSITVTAEGGEPQDITAAGTFLMPASDVTVEVRFARINPFKDVTEENYYYEAVLWAYYHEPQVTAGTSKTKFSPDRDCTREQIVTYLWKACGAPEPEGTENPFRDVDPNAYYYKAVLWAKENGVTSGVSKTKFGVGQGCAREQVVTFLWKACGSPEPEGTENPFPRDVNPEMYYYKAILWAKENGVTGGVGKNKFGVGQICTRAQVVTFLYKAVG